MKADKVERQIFNLKFPAASTNLKILEILNYMEARKTTAPTIPIKPRINPTVARPFLYSAELFDNAMEQRMTASNPRGIPAMKILRMPAINPIVAPDEVFFSSFVSVSECCWASFPIELSRRMVAMAIA